MMAKSRPITRPSYPARGLCRQSSAIGAFNDLFHRTELT
jgi:hypothetical protein